MKVINFLLTTPIGWIILVFLITEIVPIWKIVKAVGDIGRRFFSRPTPPR